jgi:outer membrane biosynthesis protein TonB
MMQRSYLVKSPVHFADFGFFVKVGDILVHDTANANKLTVYRNGGVVKAVQQTTLGIAAMVKNEVIVEVIPVAQTPTAAPKAPAKPIVVEPKPQPKESKPLPKPAPTKKREEPVIIKPEPKKAPIEDERSNAVPTDAERHTQSK